MTKPTIYYKNSMILSASHDPMIRPLIGAILSTQAVGQSQSKKFYPYYQFLTKKATCQSQWWIQLSLAHCGPLGCLKPGNMWCQTICERDYPSIVVIWCGAANTQWNTAVKMYFNAPIIGLNRKMSGENLVFSLPEPPSPSNSCSSPISLT